MSFMPIIVMNSILLVITLLLIVADRLLVSYGTCKITVTKEDSTDEFEVEGGATLMANLIEHGFKINSSCAGKATCGYCKVGVSQGGGDVLPTEEIFISREEKAQNMRLACQVKVKEDIQLFVPDLITTVKSMARNGTFDTRLDWKFIKKDKPEETPELKKPPKIDKKARIEIDVLVEEHRGNPGAIMPILQDINGTSGYLPEPVIRYLAQATEVPLATIFRLATFYNAFSFEPRGRNMITVCMGTACHVKGAANILAAFEEQLGIKSGETTEDLLFSLDAVRCIGCCGLAPVLTINEEVHGLMTKKKVPELIDTYRKVPANV